MLTTYLHGFISKFILLEDDLEEPGHELFKYLITQIFKTSTNIIYCQFSFNLRKNISNKEQPSMHICDMTKLQTPEALQMFTKLITTSADSILIIDSLAHMIAKLGARDCYKLLIQINKKTEIKQILTQLHCDLLHEADDIIHHISALTTLHIKMERQFGNRPRVSYVFKKGRGKIIRAIEEFSLVDGKLTMMDVAEINVKSLLQANATDVNSLTTFNIKLNEQDKISRSQMDLPFLPRDLRTDNVESGSKQGEIDYVFDAGDDWDAEDPDDDLDI